MQNVKERNKVIPGANFLGEMHAAYADHFASSVADSLSSWGFEQLWQVEQSCFCFVACLWHAPGEILRRLHGGRD